MDQPFAPEDDGALANFVQNGFVVYRGVFDQRAVDGALDFVMRRYVHLIGATEQDVNGWSVAIMQELERSWVYQDLIFKSPKLRELCKKYVGPDVSWLGHDGLFINAPKDKDPVLVKGHHTDVWTGTGVNTVFAALFLTDVDEYNGLSVCPGSHLQGLTPVLNRAIHPNVPALEVLNLKNIKAGDLVVWHALLIHSTTGHSDKNIRVSITSRFKSTEAEMTSQERALGYRSLSVGPLNQVTRLVGNDYLTPFRTLGGYVGVDRRVADVYNYSPFKAGVDYDAALRDFR